MNLGKSMRRRRSWGRRPGREPESRGSSGAGHSQTLRTGALAVLVTLFGLGGGYLLATRAILPAPVHDLDLLEVPDLRGLDLDGASSLLRERGLQLGSVDSIRHPRAPEGVILGQSPLRGQLSPEGGPVHATLSLGPERRPVPDVTRLRGDRARTVLAGTGFEVVVDSVESDLPAGRVVSVFPEEGTEVTLPGEVVLEVSLGPPLVEMPVLTGLQEDEALAVLDSLGLVVAEVESRFRFGFSQGTVLDQEPEAGREVERGSAVRIVIGRRGFFQ